MVSVSAARDKQQVTLFEKRNKTFKDSLTPWHYF